MPRKPSIFFNNRRLVHSYASSRLKLPPPSSFLHRPAWWPICPTLPKIPSSAIIKTWHGLGRRMNREKYTTVSTFCNFFVGIWPFQLRWHNLLLPSLPAGRSIPASPNTPSPLSSRHKVTAQNMILQLLLEWSIAIYSSDMLAPIDMSKMFLGWVKNAIYQYN